MLVEKPTVLVLGAGTAMHYGFPSGLNLLHDIQRSIGNRGYFDKLCAAGCGVQTASAFREAVTRCGRSSIDAFLGDRGDLADVGKAAIAASLIRCESDHGLFAPPDARNPNAPSDSEHFYRYLFTRLSDDADLETFKRHRLTVVTYNYDRSLEHYLHQAIKHSYNLSDADAAAVLTSTIPIIHVHGQLAKLPWQGDPAATHFTDGVRAYNPDDSPDAIRSCISQLRVIGENDLRGSEEYVRARAALADADVVCFLGFGYDRRNVRRLMLDGWKPNVAIFGTVYGLTPRRIQEASECIGRSFNQDGGGCVAFLEKLGPIV